MKKNDLIKVNATNTEKQVRATEAVRRGMSLSAYMLTMSDPDKRKPSDEHRLLNICIRDKAIAELTNMASAISKSPLSPIDARMILRQLAIIEDLLKTSPESKEDFA